MTSGDGVTALQVVDAVRAPVVILLGPGTAESTLPPWADLAGAAPRDPGLLGWRRRHRSSLRALAQAVARVPAACALSLAIEPDTAAWFRDAADWFELRSARREDEQLFLPLVNKPADAVHPGLGETIFDLRRLHDPRWITARARCNDAALLVVGADIEDTDLQNLLRDLRRRTPGPAGWVVSASEPSFRAQSLFDDLGFSVIATKDPLTLLSAFGEGRLPKGVVEQRDSHGRVNVVRPYRLLDSYSVDEEVVFFGRQTLSERLFRLVAAFRLVVVTGASGSGKTSLINAGLLARMRRQSNILAVTIRCGADAVRDIVTAINARLDPVEQPPFSGSLSQYLEVLRRRHFPIIVLDQAEEIYTRLGERSREELLGALRRCLCHSPQVAAFVISLREDYLAGLTDLRTSVPTLLQTTLYVPPLAPHEAAEAIVGPARVVKLAFDMELVEPMINELVSGNRGAITPPQLQIVCSMLYDEWRRRGASASGIDRPLYDTLGGCRGILSEFVDRSLAELRAAGDEEVGWSVLKAMVTSDATKDLLALDEVASRAGLDSAIVRRLLNAFRDGPRLVRELTDERGPRFELAHEYLVASIWRRMSEEDRRRRRVEEDLAREIRAWQHFADVRLGVDRLKRYSEFPDLVARDEGALTLVLLSTIKNLQPRGTWAEVVARLAEDAQDRLARILLDYVAGKDVAYQRESAEVLARLDSPVLLRAIEQSEPRLRHAAIRIAAAIQLPAVVGVLTAAVMDWSIPVAVRKDALAGLLRTARDRSLPAGSLSPLEAALVKALEVESPDRQSFAVGALLDFESDIGLRAVVRALVSKARRSLVLNQLDADRAARLARFLRYRRNRPDRRKLWCSLAAVHDGPAQDAILRELLNLTVGTVAPTNLGPIDGWPLSKEELDRALAVVKMEWLAENLRLLRDIFELELPVGCSAEQARAFLATPNATARVTRNAALFRHVWQVLSADGDTKLRRNLIRDLESNHWKMQSLDPSAWEALLVDADLSNRATAYRLAARFGSGDVAIRGLTDPSTEVQIRTLEGFIESRRPIRGPLWKEPLRVMVSSKNTELATLSLVGAAAQGFSDIVFPRILELNPEVLGKVLAHVPRLVTSTDTIQSAVLVELTLNERFVPFQTIAPSVITSLAGVWSQIETRQQDRLLAFAVHHATASVRTAAVTLAKASRNMDVLKFLLADPRDEVREAAWKYLLEAKPQEVQIDPDTLGRLIADIRANTDLRVTACGVAQHHQVVEVVNALKDIADSESKTRDGKTTLGKAARAALLTLWPESATWIRSRLKEN